MSKTLPPLPPHVGEENHGPSQQPVKLYDADQMKAYALAAIAAQGVQRYDQQALELCEVCGWKTRVPDEGCLNCERKPLTDEQKQRIHDETGAGHALIALVESYINGIKE